eukprot:6480271-Amphidinium_carterae.2
MHHLACYVDCTRWIPKRTGGIVIEILCADRAMYSALSELIWQHCEAHMCQHEYSEFEKLLQWNLAIPCSMHDAQNALKWAVAGECQSSALVSDLYIVVESLRNTFDLLHSRLPDFIRTHLRFTDELLPQDTLYQFWLAVGATGEVLHVLVNLQVRFVEGRLLVASSWQDKDDLSETVAYCLLYLFRFRSFTESRWLSLGCTAQTLVGALYVGLEVLVQMIRTAPHSSDYYIHGFGKLGVDLKEMLLVTLFPGFVVNAFMGELMEDDRVLLRSERFQAVMSEELSWMLALPRDFWAIMLSAVGAESSKLELMRSKCLHAAHTAEAFIVERALVKLEHAPWNLFAAEQSQAFTILENMTEEPVDSNSRKIWRLYRTGSF